MIACQYVTVKCTATCVAPPPAETTLNLRRSPFAKTFSPDTKPVVLASVDEQLRLAENISTGVPSFFCSCMVRAVALSVSHHTCEMVIDRPL